MNNIRVLNDIYKPYRHTIKGKTTIIETLNGNFVLKNKNANIKGLYNYLKSRNFYNYPEIIDSNRKEVNVFEYIEDSEMPKEQKGEDLISLAAILHHKTGYYKEVSEDKFKEIYEDIKSNILYYKNYYNQLYNNFFSEIYMSPSHYLFMKNFYKIESALNFCENELDNWYEIVKTEKKERVAVIHNNLSIDHFFKNEKDYLISWDNYRIDTPILDLYKFYQNNYFELDFSSILEKYLDRYPLFDHEKKLFFLLISIPKKMSFDNTEFENCRNIRNYLDYIFKTEALIRPYYASEKIE